ncbi:hypothetical protein IP76_13270 [Rhizobium sp. AAP43]|nr:hypothetical protein IP76_13270 [Rhizobium sp. AAP43]
MHETAQRQPIAPAFDFQFGLAIEFRDEADAQIADDLDMLGNSEHSLHILLVEDADPTNPDTLGPRSKPEVLDGTDG